MVRAIEVESHMQPGGFWLLSPEQRTAELGRQRYYSETYRTSKKGAKETAKLRRNLKNAALRRHGQRVREAEDG